MIFFENFVVCVMYVKRRKISRVKFELEHVDLILLIDRLYKILIYFEESLL